MVVENVSSYAEFHDSNMTEWEFLNEVVEQADCGIWCGPITSHFGHLVADFAMRVAASVKRMGLRARLPISHSSRLTFMGTWPTAKW